MNNKAKIFDIYMGHIDAKDELNYGTEETFLECFVMPPSFNELEITKSHKFVISGLKGVGKTALLYYLESVFKEEDPHTCTSFMLFKSDFKDHEKKRIDTVAKRLVQAISFDNSSMKEITDFVDIWKMILFQRIVEDNNAYSDNLFVQDEYWDKFKKAVNSVKILTMNKDMIMKPRKVKLISTSDPQGMPSAGLEIDFDKELNYKTLGMFSSKVLEITNLFTMLKRTDIPYYMFVDELEAFYEDERVFRRDLTMLRDLILTIKEINFLISSSNMINTKIICSVRTEIINSIHRFVPTKELNKAISGFECRLNWNYFNTVAIQHPLFQILLKRLMVTDKMMGNTYDELNDVFKAWFPQTTETDRIVNHILTYFWNKPRDVIRLIGAMKSSTASSMQSIDQEVISQSIKEYSVNSLVEISDELNAMYTPVQTGVIQAWLRGFKSPFTVEEFVERIESFSNTKLYFPDINIEAVLQDLYRVGVVGNYSPYQEKHRWQHKLDDEAIIGDGWLFTFHNGLNSSLSIVKANTKDKGEARIYYDFNTKALNKDDLMVGKITKVTPYNLFLDLKYNNRYYKGFMETRYYTNVDRNIQFDKDDFIQVVVKRYDVMHKNWVVRYKGHVSADDYI